MGEPMKIHDAWHCEILIVLCLLLGTTVLGIAFGEVSIDQGVKTNAVSFYRNDRPLPSEVAAARKAIKEFTTNAVCGGVKGVLLPQLPIVSTNVLRSLELMQKFKDGVAAADIAALFLRYARQVQETQGHGAAVDGTNPIVQTLLRILNPRLPGDEIVSSSLATWICQNRNRVAESDVLDKEIHLYQELERRISQKYERMRREGEEKARSGEAEQKP